jgi:hypothetical protein
MLTGGSGLAGVDVSNDDDVDVSALVLTAEREKSQFLMGGRWRKGGRQEQHTPW